MLFKKEKPLRSKGFPEYPKGFTHFEEPFFTLFLEANPGSQLHKLEGFTVYHFDHTRLGGGGQNSTCEELNYILLRNLRTKAVLFLLRKMTKIGD
jgi:hypothetical protein